MKINKKAVIIFISVLFFSAAVIFCVKNSSAALKLTSELAVKCALSFLPKTEKVFDVSQAKESETKESETQAETEKAENETTTKAAGQAQPANAQTDSDFYATDEDVKKLTDEAKSNSQNDKKDGAIVQKTYVNEGVTDQSGIVKIKNTNKTQIDVEALLSEKADLSLDKKKPEILIYHTHTTEAFQYLDRDFYAVGFKPRSNDPARNMVRVGEEICAELEKAGYKVLHDKTIHDESYSGAYAHSKASVEKYLKQYPSIQITLDIHRDAIEQSDGTKIKPTAQIGSKKAAQVMIISGCQEQGNGIEDFADWRYNLVFAVQLQKAMEENFPSLTRPLFFCPRRYNMNLTRCSLLIEIGSDANTLEEAVLSGRCVGKSLAVMLEEYTQ
ncbi:MAG: stage II sporulation protein P [Acutalibacteraceae bacterium]